MEEAGYDGEPVRILASNDYEDHYNMAVVLEDQLSNAGMNVELMVTDWPTATEMNDDPEAYEIFVTTIANWPALPATFMFYTEDWPGFTDSPEITAAAEDLLYADDDETATAAMEELQQAHDGYLPVLKIGDRSVLYGMDSRFAGFEHVPGVGAVLHNLQPAE